MCHPAIARRSLAAAARLAALAALAALVAAPLSVQAAQPAVSTAAAASGAASPAIGPQPDLVILGAADLDGCLPPARPGTPPDGSKATRAQMKRSQTSATAFDTATDAYLACVDQAAGDFERQYGALLSAEQLRDVRILQTKLHNDAVDVDQQVADAFNRQLRVFNARGKAK